MNMPPPLSIALRLALDEWARTFLLLTLFLMYLIQTLYLSPYTHNTHKHTAKWRHGHQPPPGRHRELLGGRVKLVERDTQYIQTYIHWGKKEKGEGGNEDLPRFSASKQSYSIFDRFVSLIAWFVCLFC